MINVIQFGTFRSADTLTKKKNTIDDGTHPLRVFLRFGIWVEVNVIVKVGICIVVKIRTLFGIVTI